MMTTRQYYHQLSRLLLLSAVFVLFWNHNHRATEALLFAARPINHHSHLGGQTRSAYFQLSLHASSSSSSASSSTSSELLTSRRQLLQESLKSAVTVAAGVAAAATALPQPSHAAGQDDELIDVYFGCGCFWHIQNFFVELEKSLLQRTDLQLTSRAGYAGGGKKATAMKDGKVCYHNAAQIGDYGTLGHAEVVSMQIPKSTFPQFAAEYCSLYSKDGYRPDQFGDRGSEYRNLVGIPGGVKSSLAKQLVDTSIQNGDKLDFAKGKGDDPDARGLVFIMDTAEYPFYVAEQYHQFHDGFNLGENYPNSYNNIAAKLAKEGKLGQSTCPNGLLGLGALGL